MKILAITVCLVLLVMLVAPISTVDARIPAVMNVIQYRYFATQDQLFNALLTPDNAGGVDVMGWPLTQAEYQTSLSNPNIVVEPLSEAGEFELAFNNNWTDGILLDRRSPMNFTDFRNAMNCLVDKNGVINGPTLGGFATRDDTQIPQPLMSGFVNPSVSYPNYPWEFNVTHALEILYLGGWYNHGVYPSFADLLAAYGGGNGTLSTAGGTANGVVYSGNDPYGQWGGSDPNATANTAIANMALQPLRGYVSRGDARKDLGDLFCAELKAIGCPYYAPTLCTLCGDPLRPYVIDFQEYDFATLGYSMSSPPNWFYSELTPVGIYSGGPNPYLVQDANMTYWATQMYNAPNQTLYQIASNNVQDILVMESYLVSVYTPATFCAYKAGLLGQVDIVGQGTEANGAQTENWVTLNSRKNNTISYSGPPSSTPESNILYVGLYNPPDQINPIFQDEVFDFQISDEMFTYPLASNPYTVQAGSAITGVPSGGDLPWMAYAWNTDPIADPYNASNPQWTNVTLWLRNDITWQDGQPFTDLDLNYTVYINAFYGDAYDNAAIIFCANVNQTSAGGNADWQYQANPGDPNYAAPYFTQHPSTGDPSGLYCCSFLVSTPSWLNLYRPLYQTVPYHKYKYIIPSNMTQAEEGTSTDGLHGLWPGELATTMLPGAPFTLSTLQNDPGTTWVGTGPWKYREGSFAFTMNGPVGPTLDTYSGFFLTPAPGAIAFRYTWLNAGVAQQSSGGYWKIGLSDLVYLANAYGTTGTPPSTVPISKVPGAAHTWNPAADLAAPSGVIGLSDLVTLALHYGWYYGNYSYAAPYPPSEIANGGP